MGLLPLLRFSVSLSDPMVPVRRLHLIDRRSRFVWQVAIRSDFARHALDNVLPFVYFLGFFLSLTIYYSLYLYPASSFGCHVTHLCCYCRARHVITACVWTLSSVVYYPSHAVRVLGMYLLL